MSCRQMWVNVPKDVVKEALARVRKGLGKYPDDMEFWNAFETILGIHVVGGWEDGSTVRVSYEDAKLIGYWSK